MNPTPVAWWEQDESALSFKAFRGGAWTPLFTLDQLQQARADVLREAAEKFDKKAGCANSVGGCSTLAAIELRRMATEIQGGKN